MNYEITENTVFPLVNIHLSKNEEVQIERGAMVYHNGKVELTGKMNSKGKGGVGGALKALGRSVTSGESIFITKVTGLAPDAMIAVAPATPGVVRNIHIGPTQWRLNTGAFLACDASVHYEMKRQNLSHAFFGGTGGLFVMETAGEGDMLINSYGDIVAVEMDGTQPMVVDNLHVLAWSSSLEYSIEVASGTFGFTTGEGLVNSFSGRGTILLQTRNLEALADSLRPYLPTSSN